ncbi:MAG: hypothetical protein KIT86_11900 [Hydrogenophaga sp.]|nr:hypothetical protein [Hydrogenophaga sp.]
MIPSFTRAQPHQPDLTAIDLADRFDRMCGQRWLPEEWSNLKREAGLLLLGEQPDLDLLQQLQHHYQEEPVSLRGYFKSGQALIRHLNRALDGLENLHGPYDPVLLRRQVDEVLTMLGEGPQYGPIFRDAAATAFANFLGYVAGTAIQTAMEHGFCNEGGDLPYEKRVAAELTNRLVQHGVRFALRDLAIPAVKQCLGLRTLKAPARVHLWILMVALVVCAFDQIGLAVANQLPPVRRTGSRQLPDVGDSALQTGLFAATDLLAWTTIGYLSQRLFKSWYQQDPLPLIGLRTKAITHGIQALGEGLLLPAWKHHMNRGLSPDNLCQRGTEPVEFHSFVALFDGIEIGTFWLMTLVLGCMDRQEEAPLSGVIEHSVSNLSVSQGLRGNGSQIPMEGQGDSVVISEVPRSWQPLGVQGVQNIIVDDDQHEASDEDLEEHRGLGIDGGGVRFQHVTPPNLEVLDAFRVGLQQQPFV